MTDILPFLKSMISVSGLSGHEAPIAKIIEDKWRTLVDEISHSRVGSLHGLKKGSGKSPRPSVMIATHMDAIGMMVSSIEEGFLHITNVGGIDWRVLPGALVGCKAGWCPRSLLPSPLSLCRWLWPQSTSRGALSSGETC